MLVAIFVDGSNIFKAQDNELGWKIDYKRVCDYFKERLQADVKAYYFYPDYIRYKEHDSFIALLVKIEYQTIAVPSKRYWRGEKKRYKDNTEVEIALKAATTMDSYDTAVLFSGDFYCLSIIRHLKNNGKKVICVAAKESVDSRLRKEADDDNSFIELNRMKEDFQSP